MALSLDGSAHVNATSASPTVTLSTTNTNDIIIICITSNGAPVLSVTSANLTFANVASDGIAAQKIDMWYAVASGALSSEVITVNNTLSAFTTIDAFGISGANTASPFDGSAVTYHAPTTDPISISTTVADTFIIGAFRFASTASPTEGTGFTKIFGANFQLTEYKIVSTTQSGLSVSVGTGAGNGVAGIAQAIKIASGGGGRTAIYIPGPHGPMVI